VEPLTGERFFLVLPNCNTNNMNIFLKKLSPPFFGRNKARIKRAFVFLNVD